MSEAADGPGSMSHAEMDVEYGWFLLHLPDTLFFPVSYRPGLEQSCPMFGKTPVVQPDRHGSTDSDELFVPPGRATRQRRRRGDPDSKNGNKMY